MRILEFRHKYRVRALAAHSDKPVDPSSPPAGGFRVVVESYMLFNGWSKIQTFFGGDYAEMMSKAEEFVACCESGGHWLRLPTYTLRDALACRWSSFKWRWLNFGHVGRLRGYVCPGFLPLKKVWYFGWPRLRLREVSGAMRSWLRLGPLNRLLADKFGKYLSLETPRALSPLAPMGRSRLNPFFALYVLPLGWKDKYGTPRYECPPQVSVWLLGVFNAGFQLYPDFDACAEAVPEGERWHRVDSYWEQSLWAGEYCGGDIAKARETWPWRTVPMEEGEAEESSWSDMYLV